MAIADARKWIDEADEVGDADLLAIMHNALDALNALDAPDGTPRPAMTDTERKRLEQRMRDFWRKRRARERES